MHPEFCLCASVLLASYGDGPADTVQLTPAQHESSTTAPAAGVNDHTQPGRDLIPARVRGIR